MKRSALIFLLLPLFVYSAPSRKIAREENPAKTDAEARQKQILETKKIKETFFMRTFQR